MSPEMNSTVPVSPQAIPASPEAQFRETDGEYLKQQARIWLETVLNERFDADKSLADLLVDGEILVRLSTKIRSLMQNVNGLELASPTPLFPEAAFYGKHGGKYLPYSNVDTFLKICQKLGLTAVDLFSPPDVVEKRDIRRVCLCIRALSKKARAKQLDVPEFDYVTHNVVLAMPTEFVGGIKESLTLATSATPPKSAEQREAPEKLGLSPLILNNPFWQREMDSSDGDSEERDNSDTASNPESPVAEESPRFSYNGDLENTKLPHLQISRKSTNASKNKNGFWVPLVVLGAALLGTISLMKSRRTPAIYEVKRGDTLSRIARKTGKTRWEELARLNPEIMNPDLIYPNERIRLNL